MPITSGLTTFGVVRKLMADLFIDFSQRIKENGSFGATTTLDNPDAYPGDPLVSLAAAASASDHELWEIVEHFYSQLDPTQASGVYLQRFHGDRLGLTQGVTETEENFRTRILNHVRNNISRVSRITVAEADANVSCAEIVRSTTAAPLNGIAAPAAMLVVKGSPADANDFAQSIYDAVDVSVHNWVGDQSGQATTVNGGCLEHRWQEACPVVVDVRVVGYFKDQFCVSTDADTVLATVLERLNAAYASCGFGTNLTSSELVLKIGEVGGFVVSRVDLRRRAKMLWGDGCDMSAAPVVTIDGTNVTWASSQMCGYCAGETWCDDYFSCLALNAWEYPVFDAQFASLAQDATGGGCVQINDTGCPTFSSQNLCRVFIGIRFEFEVDTTVNCDGGGEAVVRAHILERLKFHFSTCQARGMQLTNTDLLSLIGSPTGYNITELRLERRAPQLVSEGCMPDDPKYPIVDLVRTPWWTSETRPDQCHGETWYNIQETSVTLMANEFPDFDAVFIEYGDIA